MRPAADGAVTTRGGESYARSRSPGDTVCLLTDGIVEARSTEAIEFGAGRALDLVRANRRETAHQIVETLVRGVRQHCFPARNHDDLTAVVLKVK